nr:MAG TPA: hypothetical protein [Bacteriophage sp.]
MKVCFLVVKQGKCLILVGFDDMGYDKWFEMGKLGFCLILLGFLRIGEGWIFELVCG